MGFSFLGALSLFSFGINALAEDLFMLGMGFIIGSIALPLLVSVSLYPIFALSNIDDNLSLLKKEVAEIAENIKRRPRQNEAAAPSEDACKQEESIEKDQESLSAYEKALLFIKEKYGVSIDMEDSVAEIKAKINSIDDQTWAGTMLKHKINSATSKEEIFQILSIHRVTHL